MSYDKGFTTFISQTIEQVKTGVYSEPEDDILKISTGQQNRRSMTDLTRQEVDAKLAQNKAEVDARLANFDTSIKTGFAELRAEMAKQSGDMRTEMANIRAEMHKGTIDIIKWVVGFGIAILGTVFTLSKTAEKPAPGAQPTPIVITVPGSTVAPTQTPVAPQPTAKK